MLSTTKFRLPPLFVGGVQEIEDPIVVGAFDVQAVVVVNHPH